MLLATKCKLKSLDVNLNLPQFPASVPLFCLIGHDSPSVFTLTGLHPLPPCWPVRPSSFSKFLLTLFLSQSSHCLSSPFPSDVSVDFLPFCSPLQFDLWSNPRSVRQTLLFQEAVRGLRAGRGWMWGVWFLAQETAVNQIVKDEVFLSSHLEWISLSSVATQRSLAGWKDSSACLHLDKRRGSVPWTLLKVIASS